MVNTPANPDNNLFEADVPAPLSKFDRSVVDGDNELILREAEDARFLPAGHVRKYERRLKELNDEVEKSGYYGLRSQLEALKQEWSALQLELYPLRLEWEQLKAQPVTDESRSALITINSSARRIIRQQRAIQQKAQIIKQQIQPLLPAVRKRNTCELRLKEHYAAVAHKKLDDKLTKDMAREASWFADIIIDRLSRLGYCHRYTVNRMGQLTNMVDRVKIERIVVTPDSLQYKFLVTSVGYFGNTITHLPDGVAGADLVSEDTLKELTIACERSVTSPHANGTQFINGAWIEISRNDFVDGLPRFVTYKAVMSRYPNDLNEKFPLPMGVMSGRKVNIVRLTDHPHMLISGQSGSGKSNTLHVILLTLIQMHSPDAMRLCLIDLKAGVEFVAYEGIPHVIGGHPISKLEQATQILYQLDMLVNERLEEVKKLGLWARDIDAYNRYCPPDKRMPRIIIVIEEIQLIDKNKDLAKQFRASLDVIASTGRAAGIQLIICTQAAFSDVVPKITQTNITCKIAGSQETLGAALATSGNTKTQHLEQLAGRMWVKRGPSFIQVQMPYVNNDDIQNALARANEFDAPRPLSLPALPDVDIEAGEIIEFHRNTMTPDTLIRYALEELDGEFNASKMIKDGLHSRYGISEKKLRAMVNEIRDRRTVELDGTSYEIAIERNNVGRFVALAV